jgi:uncharacterized membrane protein YecN with MAPEG domain
MKLVNLPVFPLSQVGLYIFPALLLLCLSTTRIGGSFYLLVCALILLFTRVSAIPGIPSLVLVGRYLRNSASGFFLFCFVFFVFICSLLSLAPDQAPFGPTFSSFRPSAFHILLSAIYLISVFFCIRFVGALSSLGSASFPVARNVAYVLLVWSLCALAFSGFTLLGSSHEPASNLRPTEGLYVTASVLYFYVRVFSRIEFLRMSKWQESLADIFPVFLAVLVVASFGGTGAWIVLLLSLCRNVSRLNSISSLSVLPFANYRIFSLSILALLLVVALFLWDPVSYLVVKSIAYVIGFSETPRFYYLYSFSEYVRHFPPLWFGASSASWGEVLSHNTFWDMSVRYGVVPASCLLASILSSAAGVLRLSLRPGYLLLPIDLVGLPFFFCYLLIQPVPISDSYASVLMVFLLSLTSAFCSFLLIAPSTHTPD